MRMKIINRISKIIIAIAILFSLVSPLHAYDNVIYIWQRNWDGHLEYAISAIQEKTGYFTVLCGDLKFEGKKPTINLVDIKWDYLTQTETSATLAFRINTQACKFFATEAVYSIADSINDALCKIIDSAMEWKIEGECIIVGVQFDYDCPTSKLKDYARFLGVMQERLQPFKQKLSKFNISITALPTWLQSNDFMKLAQITDYYVLQLHSFELPKDANQANKIFPYDKAKSYIKKASQLRYPYYISLPTYGYEVAFSREGKFLGLRAEGDPIRWGEEVSCNTEIADPDEILTFTQYLKNTKPKYFLGVHWFRLPLKSDEFNWDIKTLVAIIEGRQPTLNIKTQLINSEDGLCEVYIINDGEQNIVSPVRFELNWDHKGKVVYDVLEKYNGQRTKEGLEIEGPAPSAGKKALVAWFRTTRNIEGSMALEVSDVKICKDN